MEVEKVLLMGVPNKRKIDGLSPMGGVTDWLMGRFSRDAKADNIIFYNNGGSHSAQIKMEEVVHNIVADLGEDPLPHKLPKVIGTWFTSNSIINYGSKAASLYPFEVDVVLVMTTPQYHRQLKSNPNKMRWADWFTKRNIPVLVAQPNGMWDNDLSRL